MYLKISDAAKILGISKAKAYKLVKSKKIPFVRIGSSIRVPEKTILDYCTVPVAAKELNISTIQCYRLIKRRIIKATYFGPRAIRVKKGDLEMLYNNEEIRDVK